MTHQNDWNGSPELDAFPDQEKHNEFFYNKLYGNRGTHKQLLIPELLHN